MHVTVLMAVWNESDNICDAIDSIINQTYNNWDLLVIDDCSTDCTQRLLLQYEKQDSRITVIRNSKNLGLARSLNIGLRAAKGDLIARMDGDDTCFPERLDKQVHFMKHNPRIDVLGSGAELVNKNGKTVGFVCMPETHQEIYSSIYKKNPFIHSSVIMRKEFIARSKGYANHLRRKQDYVLWAKMLKSSKYHNIPDILIRYQTNSYIRPLKTIFYGLYVSIFIIKYHKHFIFGNIWAFIIFFRALAVKLNIYKPKSLRKYND